MVEDKTYVSFYDCNSIKEDKPEGLLMIISKEKSDTVTLPIAREIRLLSDSYKTIFVGKIMFRNNSPITTIAENHREKYGGIPVELDNDEGPINQAMGFRYPQAQKDFQIMAAFHEYA